MNHPNLDNANNYSFWYWISYSLSIIFHPVVMPTLIIVCLFSNGFPMFTSQKIYLQIIFRTLLSTGLIPSIFLYTMYKLGFVRSLEMSQRKERITPFILVSIFYIFITVLHIVSYHIAGLDFVLILSGITCSILAVTVITIFHKISAHTVGVSGMCGVFFGLQVLYPVFDLMNPILFSITLTGCMMSARIYVKAHTPLETLTGFLVGFGTCFGIFLGAYLISG